MKILVTGHNGYIGSVLAPLLQDRGHDVEGVDSFLFEECTFGPSSTRPAIPSIRMDIRDLSSERLRGFDAVVHLAAISNDPLGDLNPACTLEINHEASVRLARIAKGAGVRRFLFASSCSLYGAAGADDLLSEDAPFNPITPYGQSKVLVEQEVASLADDGFSPTFLRNATAYGLSPRLRVDIVVNNLTGFAVTTGEVRIMSDGSPWRPLVHVEDISLAFRLMLEAPRETVHNQAFNVGVTTENHRISEVAEVVADSVPGSRVVYGGGGPDSRTYRVDFSKLENTFDEWRPRWRLRSGVGQLVAGYRKYGLNREQFLGPRFTRLAHITELMRLGKLDQRLRPIAESDTTLRVL